MKSAYTRIHAVKEKEKYEEEKQTKKSEIKDAKRRLLVLQHTGCSPKQMILYQTMLKDTMVLRREENANPHTLL